MQKYIYSMAATFIIAALAMGSFTACSNEDLVVETQNTIVKEAPTCYFTLPASFDKGAQVRAVTIGEKTARTTFASTDKVYVVIEHNGTYAIGYEPSGSAYLSMTVTPDADPSKATLSGALKFYYDFKGTPTAFTPAVDDVVYLLYNMTNPFCPVSYSSFAYDQQNGSKDQSNQSGLYYYYGASYHDYAQAKMKITEVTGSTDVGFTMSLVQYDDPTKSNVSFQNLGSLFRQKLTFKDKNGDPVTPTLTKFTISTANDKMIIAYFPFASDPAAAYYYSLFSIENPVIDTNGDIYFALMFNDDNKNETLYFTAEDDDGNVYTASKAAPAGGFENGKYYYGKMELTWENHLVDLSQLNGHYVAQNGDILTGTLAGDYKISIADGATVTLSGITINGGNDSGTDWAGITCEGDATLVLVDGTSNSVKPFYSSRAAISVPNGKTLTIQGSGSLTADSNSNGGFGASIGGDAEDHSGNIVITGAANVTAYGGYGAAGIGSGSATPESPVVGGDITISTTGTVTAYGGTYGAGIGGGISANLAPNTCGNILITKGTIVATGGQACPGIGAGYSNGGKASTCGTVTITDGVTKVTATRGVNSGDGCCIGPTSSGFCGTVTIGGTVYWGPEDSDPTQYEFKNGGQTYLMDDLLIFEP